VSATKPRKRRAKTSPGLREYGALRSADDASIVVYQSSAQGERCAWLNVLASGAEEAVIVHLNAEQARELAKALLAFVEEGS
jgi:hypothetical protein